MVYYEINILNEGGLHTSQFSDIVGYHRHKSCLPQEGSAKPQDHSPAACSPDLSETIPMNSVTVVDGASRSTHSHWLVRCSVRGSLTWNQRYHNMFDFYGT